MRPDPAAHRRLAAAMLLQMTRDLVSGRDAPEGPRRELAQAARAWFEEEDQDWPLSFKACCDAANLPAAAIFARVMVMTRAEYEAHRNVEAYVKRLQLRGPRTCHMDDGGTIQRARRGRPEEGP